MVGKKLPVRAMQTWRSRETDRELPGNRTPFNAIQMWTANGRSHVRVDARRRCSGFTAATSKWNRLQRRTWYGSCTGKVHCRCAVRAIARLLDVPRSALTVMDLEATLPADAGSGEAP